MPVVDASVITAYFKRDDVGHVESAAWLRAMVRAGQHITAPTVLLAEVGAAVRRSTGDAMLGHAVVAELRQLPGLRLVPVSEALAVNAADIAVRHAMRGCDAVYVAVAEQLGETLVSLDAEQLARGRGVVRAVRPEQADPE
jgi:predicted nucleic acid-binding protein